MTLLTAAFQQATAHSWERLRQRARPLDLANQPDPFRSWPGARTVNLPVPAQDILTPAERVLGNWYGAAPSPSAPLRLESLNRLLFHSVALSARRSLPPETHGWFLRVNPSAGNLHPNETWLAARGVEGLENGLFHYRADRHALELRRRGNWVGILLGAAGRRDDPGVGLVVVLTSAFARMAWKYGPRALRYCLLDAGHAAGAVLSAARALGWSGGLLGHFADDDVAEILDCRRGGEEPLLLLPLAAGDRCAGLASAPWNGLHAPLVAGEGQPNPLTPRPVDLKEISPVFAATCLGLPLAPASDLGFGPPESSSLSPVRLPTSDLPPFDFGKAARLRRTALAHDPTAALPAGRLLALLRAGMPQPPRDWAGWRTGQEDPRQRLIRPRLWAHRVDGLPPGAYQVGQAGELYAVRHGDFSQPAAALCLGQDLAGQAGAVVALFGDLSRAWEAHGDRGWRYPYFEAGLLGQGLHLAAAASAGSATGIGAFFDEDLAQFWGLDSRGDGAPLYLYTLARRPQGGAGLVTVTDPLGLYPRG